MHDDERVIKSYVWHGGVECFFVSTIERDSSSALDPGRYNETLVWRYDWEKKERLNLCWQRAGARGLITSHLSVCEELHRDGELKPDWP